ncbi:MULTISPECIES: fluoride efflux transporter CrcB [unclassified Brevundimonas]|uniref:fluoride efflux transporter CrcB n=1 Tax=unclassified Brevundimonas TaxID=2622653 RepID=UPI0025BDAA07|nr:MULTISPECIES: fluoride efflux transporter CrcB [unclassified Brevundimonas]
MTQFLLVAIGGALGAVARYGLGLMTGRLAPGAVWPWGTFAANISGGLLMGLLAGWLALKAGAGQESVRLFAAVGVLGGFTTFSAFSLETALMIERRELATAFVYAVSSVVVSIAALFVGLMIARKLFTGVGA